MKAYWKNLWNALRGRNPYRTELDEVKAKYEKTEADVTQLSMMYQKCVEHWNAADKMVGQLNALTDDLKKQLDDRDQEIKRLRKQIKK